MTESGTATRRPIVRRKGEGTALWMIGGLYEVKVSAEESGGTVTFMEFTVPPGAGPPLHRHDADEVGYILEGTATFQVEGETMQLGPGDSFFIPRGTAECFQPTSTLRLVLAYLPGGMDRFFSEFAPPAERRELPPTATAPPDVEKLVAIGRKHGLEVAGPPIS